MIPKIPNFHNPPPITSDNHHKIFTDQRISKGNNQFHNSTQVEVYVKSYLIHYSIKFVMNEVCNGTIWVSIFQQLSDPTNYSSINHAIKKAITGKRATSSHHNINSNDRSLICRKHHSYKVYTSKSIMCRFYLPLQLYYLNISHVVIVL